jgi:hypothetical protein
LLFQTPVADAASMDNASPIFNSLNNYDDIKTLNGTQAHIFLNFKESRTQNGAQHDDGQAHFTKAASLCRRHGPKGEYS